LRRRYTSQSEEFSVRIEHAGRSHYFPLATADEATACARAAQIHRSVLRDGWEEACHRFPRELTVGFHWSADPLAWTYATIHTRPLANAWMTTPPARGAASGAVEPIAADIGPAPENRKAPLIAVVESERGLGQALEWHLGGLAASVRLLANGAEALREVPRQHFHLALVNHTLPDASGAECAEQLGHLAPRTPVLIYSAHEDSEQLFKSTPGGAFGYVLKRTAPEHLLAPIEGLFADGTLSAERVGEQVRRYFQTVTASLQAPQRLHEMSRLTPRETQILDCLSKGYLDKEIAGALGISAWTVHGHLKNIFAKLGVHSRIEAVVKYLQK
jgi:DNA-binding NarL/FixJ family response regulator